MSKKIAFKTLGCRLNQFETDALLTDFYKAGYEIVGFNDRADVYVINTCTVTNQGDHKSRTAINQAVRKRGGSLVVVTGCMATSQKAYLEGRDDINYVVENPCKSRILQLVEAHFRGVIIQPESLPHDLFDFTTAEKSFHTRSMIKIQDGCDNFCSYCIVPYVRGRAVSRPVNDVLRHITEVTALGFKEVVLTGVNISRYDYNGTGFEKLIEKILALQGNFRLRISSLEPDGIGDHFADLFSHEKLCPHLHLCLQSGSDRILEKMKRTNTVRDYYAVIDRLLARHPLFNLTTDVIVGFPGETDSDFEETCRVVKDIGFSHVHTFKFSVRKGTKAEKMPDQIGENVKKQRSEIIRNISEENRKKYYMRFIGEKQTVLVEKVTRQGLARGYGEHYLPVEFRSGRTEHNYFAQVQVRAVVSGGKHLVLRGCIVCRDN
ncbi:MAG: tRNA (N(6)-L-threonylcarbamoyladenosine(37)-C(2))-methylthiotransferase MtaB [Bacteroidales bacterium]|nr:tRNA (N(6)-L-threonylcarbamoyladenosine(37)-C(2))-methylthiotransferase MtaB [Bacteroidales bacterium]